MGYWVLGVTALAVLLLMVTFVVWVAADESIALPSVNGQDLLQSPRTALAAVMATATPTPAPTPTLTPGQLAGQFVPQLRDALSSANWDRALEVVIIMQGLDPAGEDARQWAFTTHMQAGQAMVEAGQEADAQAQFDEAVALAPEAPEALLWQRTTQMYLAGREALDAGDWQAAIESFTLAYEQMPEYGDLFARLVESYRRQGQAAIEEENWPLAVEALVQAHERAPDNQEVQALLSAAYRGQGRASMASGDWAGAIETMTEARERLPDDQDVVALLSQAYRGQGEAALDGEDWNLAVKTMVEAHERLPDDQDVEDLLALTYRQRGIARHEELKLQDAKADLKAALALRPDDAKAQKHLDRVRYLLSKKIEIDISSQRLYAWQGDKLVYKFVVSTGLRGRDTSTGRFQVLDKIPMAYSRVWRLKMPNWLGIYYVQGIENGIHALPIRPDGSVMWGGLLGQRASYGCIILSNSAARKLYNWADVGTQVHIHH